MAEDQKWQEPSNHLLCANNCGFFGSPTTLNLCSKCYKHHCLNARHVSTLFSPDSSSSSATIPVSQVPVSVFPETRKQEPHFVFPETRKQEPHGNTETGTAADGPVPVPSAADAPQQRTRCGCCRKRVGLTGFTCKCGTMFCGVHRYPEKHECSFDFKTVGKEAIAKANPVVKAAKLDRI